MIWIEILLNKLACRYQSTSIAIDFFPINSNKREFYFHHRKLSFGLIFLLFHWMEMISLLFLLCARTGAFNLILCHRIIEYRMEFQIHAQSNEDELIQKEQHNCMENKPTKSVFVDFIRCHLVSLRFSHSAAPYIRYARTKTMKFSRTCKYYSIHVSTFCDNQNIHFLFISLEVGNAK